MNTPFIITIKSNNSGSVLKKRIWHSWKIAALCFITPHTYTLTFSYLSIDWLIDWLAESLQPWPQTQREGQFLGCYLIATFVLHQCFMEIRNSFNVSFRNWQNYNLSNHCNVMYCYMVEDWNEKISNILRKNIRYKRM